MDLVDETTTSELGRVMSITTKQFTTDKHHAASASRQHWCMWIERQVAPDVQHTRQVAGKLTSHDEQLQQRSGRREGRAQHVRAHEFAQRVASDGASTTTAIAHSLLIYLYEYVLVPDSYR